MIHNQVVQQPVRGPAGGPAANYNAMQRYDSANLSKATRTPQGGIRADAALTKTGIFTYRNADGSERREYRPAQEVFKSDSLSSFKGAPLTIGHPGAVTTDNFRNVQIGHVEDVGHREDEYVVASVVVNDGEACRAIERGDLRELSVGYQVDLDPTPGQYNGERYDAVQRNIRVNHVALGPRGWGRAGRDVELRLDSGGNEEIGHTYNAMGDKAEKSGKTEQVVIQAPNMEVRVDGQAEIDRLKAENDMLRAENKRLKDPTRLDSLVKARVELLESARAALGDDFKFDGKSDREIKESVIKARKSDFRADGKSDDYVQAAFEMALSMEDSAPNAGLGKLRQDAGNASTAESPIDAARKRMEKANLEAWKQPASISNGNN